MSRFFDDLEERLREATAARGAAVPRAARPRRSGGLRRRLLVVALALLAAGAVPAVAAMTDLWRPDVEPLPLQAPPGPSARHAPPGPSARHGTAISCGGLPSSRPQAGHPAGAEFTSVLGVLARPRGAQDAGGRRYVPPTLTGVDFQGIRSVGLDAAGRRYYVVAARGLGMPAWPERCLRKLDEDQRRRLASRSGPRGPLVCLTGSGGGTCSPLADVRRYGTFGLGGALRGRAVAAGLVPNGVRAVRVTYGRSSREFPVADNFFSFEVAVDAFQQPDGVEWLMKDGSVRDATLPRPPVPPASRRP